MGASVAVLWRFLKSGDGLVTLTWPEMAMGASGKSERVDMVRKTVSLAAVSALVGALVPEPEERAHVIDCLIAMAEEHIRTAK